MAWLAVVLLAVSALWFCYVSYILHTHGNDATCTDVKPDRHVGAVIVVSAVAYFATVMPALFLLRKKEFEWAFAALMLSGVALLEPFGGLAWIAFSIAMC